MDLVALKTRVLEKEVMTAVSRSFFCPGSSLPEIIPCEKQVPKRFFFLIKKRWPFDQKNGLKHVIFCHVLPFFSKGTFFWSKNSPFFIKKSPFSSVVSADHIFFSSAGTGPLHIKWHEIYESTPRQICFSIFFRQTGTGPRPTHCGPQGKSEPCVQRADSTSDHWSLSLRIQRESL